MTIRIFHNPRCSKSRQTLQLLEERGIEPDIVLYLEEAPTAATIVRLAGMLGVPVRDLLREGEDEFRERQPGLNLDDDMAVATWLQQHPRVLQRPIVLHTERRQAVIGRPPENVLALLEA